ncbi:MAG: biotin--[acetyl-CoA-carboxylase] ligase [Flavobacteriales bacterium]|jgi:BirA family biotin operon repressor/biotin-[acetyl-CoA-carboxylase] ligase
MHHEGRISVLGGPFIELATVASTNKTAAELLGLSKLRHGSVILAHEQTEGRGQRGRTWTSVAGLDLTLSIVVAPPDLRADGQFVLSKLTALAVHDTVRDHIPGDVRIKWPNDVLVERRKVAGILIQNDLAGDRVAWSIIGIGINVNSSLFDESLAATSLSLEAGGHVDLHVVLQDLLTRFKDYWDEWCGGGRAWESAYSERLWSRGRWSDMLLDGEPVLARPMDVDPLGRLVVELEDGRVGAYGLDRLRFAAR